jgi:ketosteroid isomerase-like protein
VASESAHPEITQEEIQMKDIEALKQAEQIWVTSLKTADAKLLATLIDDRFSFIGPDAQVEDRKAYLAGYQGMKEAGIEVEGIDLSELEFRVLDEVGIVTGRVAARVTMQGTPIVENVRFTRVYRRTADGWRMMAGQGTRIPEAPDPKG